MDAFLIIVVALVAIVWLIRLSSSLSGLREQLRSVASRLDRLEAAQGRLEYQVSQRVTPVEPPSATAPAPPPTTPLAPIRVMPAPPPAPLAQVMPIRPVAPFAAPTPAPQPAAPRPYMPPPPPPAPARSISLEERLGQNWLNKLGIVILVLGIALFLGYQLKNLGPLGKSLVGLALALGILAAGVLLERRPTYRVFARALIGGGWALTFFVTFALYHVPAMQVLSSQAVDLILMLAVAAAMVVHSLRYKSQVVTTLAFLLAFLTVGISHVTLFSLVSGTLLAAGLIFVAYRMLWFELGLAGLVGVYLNHAIWLFRVLPEGGQPHHPFPDFYASAGLLLLYWLLFRLFYILRVPPTRRQQVVSTLAAILNSFGLMGLLKYQSAHPEWTFLGLLALGLAELALALLARRLRPDWRMAFVLLSSIASLLLLAAIPFRFSGTNWSLLWLLEAEILFLTGLRAREVVFRRLGILAGFAALAQLFLLNVSPIIDLRQTAPDSSHHLPTAIALLAAALLFWFNAEFGPRRFPFTIANDLDRVALLFTSYLAPIAAATGLWALVSGPWTILLWLAVALALAGVADKFRPETPFTDLATQADLLALAALIRLFAVNLFTPGHTGPITTRALTLGLAAALVYLSTFRRIPSHILPTRLIAPVYAWTATTLLTLVLFYELPSTTISLGWAAFGLVLFELGLILRKPYLRHQSYALLTAAFVRIFLIDLDLPSGHGLHGPHLYATLALFAVWLWVYQRLYAARLKPISATTQLDHVAGPTLAWFATTTAAALLYVDVREEWLPIAWAAFSVLLLAAAWLLKRTIFSTQSFALLAATIAPSLNTLFFAGAHPIPFTSSRVFCIGLASAILFLALPIAFAIRRAYRLAEISAPTTLYQLLSRPEQPFFFVPLTLVTLLLGVHLHGALITIGWSALGVLTFLFALTVAERSFRLAGLTLLLLGVTKIIFVDVWHASPSERYLTLITMGAALLLVSFLYSRFRETILKLL